jgi:hypothetical protein
MRMTRTISEATVLPTHNRGFVSAQRIQILNKSAESKGAYGLIDIKIGNPATTG